MTLGRLERESRAFFFARLAGALAACSHQKSPESADLASMRRQVVDALIVILPVRDSTHYVTSAAHRFLAVFYSSNPVGRANVGVVRNSITNVPAGWWTVNLAGRLTDVIFIFAFFFSPAPRGRTNNPTGPSQRLSTRFSLRFLV